MLLRALGTVPATVEGRIGSGRDPAIARTLAGWRRSRRHPTRRSPSTSTRTSGPASDPSGAGHRRRWRHAGSAQVRPRGDGTEDSYRNTRMNRRVDGPFAFILEENLLRIDNQVTPSTDYPFSRPIAALSRRALRRGLAALAVLVVLVGLAGSALAQGTPTTTAAEVPANLPPPAGSVLLFELAARGVQIYACEANPDDASAFIWTFKAPEAELFNRRGEVAGQHFAGPTWQGLDGSAVAGEVL